MITITNTPNLTGVTISGDFNDLYNLVEAFHEITINEYSEKHHRYIEISTRVLGLCYDIRHAYQGDREIELMEAAKERRCEPGAIRLRGIDYSDDFEW